MEVLSAVMEGGGLVHLFFILLQLKSWHEPLAEVVENVEDVEKDGDVAMVRQKLFLKQKHKSCHRCVMWEARKLSHELISADVCSRLCESFLEKRIFCW